MIQTCSQVSEVQVQVKSQVSEVKSKSSLKSLKRSPSQVLSLGGGVQVTSQVFVLFIVCALFQFKIRGNHCILNNTIQTKRLHTSSMSSFSSKLDCIISKFEAKTKWSDFSFVKLFYIKQTSRQRRQAELMQIHSLPAGGASTSIKHRFLGCRCKQSRAAVINTTLICITWRQDEKKILCIKNLFLCQVYVTLNM